MLISDYDIINSFYKGEISIDDIRGIKERDIKVKTILKKAIMLIIKAVSYTET